MREDALIGLHLLMDLLKEVLVLQMMKRDEKYQTHFHRHGYGKSLPPELDLSKLTYQNKVDILTFLEARARCYDDLLKTTLPIYVSRFEAISLYLHQAQKQVSL